jgi:branched-chain amino acid transport system permease protein
MSRDTTHDPLALLRPPAWTFWPRAFSPVLVGLFLALILHAAVQPILGGFGSSLLLFMGINMILAVSLTIVNGFTGQFSIGHAGFMSLGGYTAAAIVYYGSIKLFGDAYFHGGALSWTGRAGGFSGPALAAGDLLFVAACLAGGLVAAAAGWVVGLPSLRLRGDYLAIVTLGFGEIVRVVLQGTSEQVRRVADVKALPAYALADNLGGALGFIFVPTYTTLFWVFAWVTIMLVVAVRLKHSSYGRALLSIREDEIAAQAVGINITKYKVRAFVLSSFFAGVAGALFALQVGSINAGELGFVRSFEIIIMVVLGGLGSVSGAALAAVILTALPELLRRPPGLWPWGLLVAVVIAAAIWFRAEKPIRGLVVLVAAAAGYQLVISLAGRFGIDLSDYRMIIYSLLLILMMILRPKGLFGVRELWEIVRAPRAAPKASGMQ